jgi:hypothetical protein
MQSVMFSIFDPFCELAVIIGGFLNAATSSLKRVTGRIFKISVFREASKNLAFDNLSNYEFFSTTSTYAENTGLTL